MNTADRHLAITRVVDAPRALTYQAFTDPDDLAAWWGPAGNELVRDEMDFDLRPGGHQRWTEINPTDPCLRVRVEVDIIDIVENELIDGVMRVTGRLQDGVEPFETRLRIEFHDDSSQRTRIEIRQWLPNALIAPSQQGWQEAFAKLDALLANPRPSEELTCPN